MAVDRVDRALVRNAADPQQVKRAGRRERRREERRLDVYRTVLGTPEGRFVFWDLLGEAGVWRSPWTRDPHVTSFAAGRQNFGLELMALLLRADEALYQTMQREAAHRKLLEAREIDAGHTPPAEETQ